MKSYQHAGRAAPRPPKPVVAKVGRATLRDYGSSGRPVVFVPSLINPPLVLDLSRGNSLLRWLARQGMRPMLVDWGDPSPEDRNQDVTAHVEQLLLPLLRTLDRPPVLVGYCLGGTLAIAAASSLPVAGLATLAAPWRFSAYGSMLDVISGLWDESHESCNRLGLVPMEVLQAGFWQMDPGRTVGKFERFGRMAPNSAEARAFVALEDWANAGAPLTYAAGRQMFDEFFVADLPGRGRWNVAGNAVDPAQLACPTLSFVSTTDRIVPAASAARLSEVREVATGHVGMVVGSRARATLWQPLADWIAALPRTR